MSDTIRAFVVMLDHDMYGPEAGLTAVALQSIKGVALVQEVQPDSAVPNQTRTDIADLALLVKDAVRKGYLPKSDYSLIHRVEIWLVGMGGGSPQGAK